NVLKDLYKELKDVPNESKKEVGQAINELKKQAEEKFESAKRNTGSHGRKKKKVDLSRPADYIELGARHPLSVIRNEIIEIFSRIGFSVSEGPEIEDDWHNFSALNF